MKKLILSLLAVGVALLANAQWVNDPATNTLINDSHSEYGEIFQSRCPDGSFYIQFTNSIGGDWSPKLMYVSKDGEPQWDEPVFLGQTGSSWSQGVSMCATSDGCAVSHFASSALGADGAYAFKVNASGDVVWGPLQTSNINGGRTEVIADNNGGVWVSSTDFETCINVRHISADGVMATNLQVPLGALGGGRQKMVLAPDGGILMPYQSYDNIPYMPNYDQTIWVAKINANGELVSNNQMMNTTTIQGYQEIQCIPDGQGGGYAWIQHCGGAVDAFNVYVMHFSADGICTTYAQHPLGVQISATDVSLYRYNADGTADVLTGDLILAFRETDREYQAYDAMRVVRVSQSGELLNGEGGTVIVPSAEQSIGNFRIACAPDRSITMLYCHAYGVNDGVIKAVGTDPDFSILWAHDFNSNQCVPSYKGVADGAYEYADGQFVLFFEDYRGGAEALYGQNIQPDGTMGIVTPNPCAAPLNFFGEQYTDDDEYGAFLAWGSATGDELSFNIYRGESLASMALVGNTTSYSYYDNLTGEEGGFFYIVRAVCEEGESDPATTPQGVGYVIVNVIAPESCDAPTNLAGEYVYNEDGTFGANITWSSTDAESYNVYKALNTTDFELAGNVKTNEFLDLTEINTYYYMVKAVCESGESDPATTASGDPYIEVVVTDVNENMEAEVSVYQNGSNIIINGVSFENVDIYNVSGQIVKHVGSNTNVIDASDLNAGMYFVNIKANGKVTSKKVVIR